MEAGSQNMEEMPAESTWMPETPFKNGPQKPPMTRSVPGKQGQEPDRAICDLEATYGARISLSRGNLEACSVSTMEEASRLNVSFKALIALAEAGSSSTTGVTHMRTESLKSNPTISQEPNYNHRPAFDLNFSHESMSDAFCSKSPCQFAPVAPEKPVMRDRSEFAGGQYLCINERSNEVLNQWENESAASQVVVNQLQNDKLSQNSATDSSLAAIAPSSGNHNCEKEGEDAVNLIKTPQQKPRRKKHRPKVITESKPRPRKQTVAKPVDSKEKPAGKRKYVRRNAPNNTSTTPAVEVTGEPTNQKILEPAKKLCRRTLNFDIEGQPRDDSIKFKPSAEQEAQDNAGGNQSKSTVHLGHGIEVIVDNTQCGIAYDFHRSVNQMLQDYISPAENQAPGTQMKATDNPEGRGHVYTFTPKDTLNVHSVEQNPTQIKSQTHSQLQPILPKGFNCCTGTTLKTAQAAKEPKWKYSASIQQSNICSINLVGTNYNTLSVYNNGEFWANFQKRKRTEKGQHSICPTTTPFAQQLQDAEKPETTPNGKGPNGDHSTSNENYKISLPSSRVHELPGAFTETARDFQHDLQTLRCLSSWKEKSTRQKSRGRPTCAQNFSPVTDGVWCSAHAAHPAGQLAENCKGEQAGNSHRHQQCVQDLVEMMRDTFTKKKRTKNQGSLVNYASSCRIEEQLSGNILYKQDNFSAKTSDIRVEAMRKKFSVDGMAEQSLHLAIKKKTTDIEYTEQNALVPYSFGNEEQNALVLYRQDGTIVPYNSTFAHIKKQRPRPKVDLDEETNRVWKLLMWNINSEGIDGTDPATGKRWEEDRSVFHGRAKSFIARMHLVQGDRRFSQWKGSVVDSVIGVFLTQNVSDHLSSSAFMSLAARFPVNSNIKFKSCYEGETSSVIEKPMLCLVDTEETIKSNEMSNHSICDQNSMTLHDTEFDEEKESVNGEELSGSSTAIVNSQTVPETPDKSIKNVSTMEITKIGQACYAGESCQNSVVSSQNSVDTLIGQAAEREESFSENNLEGIGGHKINTFKGSFLELLQKAESTTLHDIYNMRNRSSQNLKNQCNYTQNMENDLQRQEMETLDGHRSSSEVSTIPTNDCNVQSSTSGVKEIERVQTITEETRYSRISEDKGINGMKDYTASTEESASHFSYHDTLNIIVQGAPKSSFAHDPLFNSAPNGNHITMGAGTSQKEDPKIIPESLSQAHNNEMSQNALFSNLSGALDVMESSSKFNEQGRNPRKSTESNWIKSSQSKGNELQEMNAAKRKAKIRRVGNEIRDNVDWGTLRIQTEANKGKRERTADTMDSVDWEAVRCANVDEIAETIKERGMNNILAGRIKDFLDRMVREHGSIDLEWLRDLPPDTAKEYLLTIRGLGLKSVECVRLLTLHHLAFPVDTNVARVAVRLGWVPLQPLPESLQLHLLELYPVMESIQKYLWPRLCKLDQKTLYEFHYQLITFGKVFCTKGKPNCNACPMRGECRHFASAFASARLALPAPEEKGIVSTTENRTEQNPPMVVNRLPLPPAETQQSKGNEKPVPNPQLDLQLRVSNCKPIVEEPSSPEPERTLEINDMEDTFFDDPDEIPTIKLNIEEFTQNLQNFMQENMELLEGDMSKALIALTAEAASIPTPKLKNVSRLRTEHHVYELPDSHPLLQGFDRREADDPSPYLLAIWTPGETADSIQPPQGSCCSQEYGKLCDEKTCYSCNSIKEANSQIVRGTLLIPCRTAMRGSFPLNGTYFQVNEVFADHDSSLNPIDVPRSWIWNLPRRTVYFGTSVPSIFRGLTTEEIQHCFWRGYVCVRGFDQKTRAPRPLMARLHFPVSKLPKNKEKNANNQQHKSIGHQNPP